MNRNRLYLLLGVAVAAGYGWLAWTLYREHQSAFTPCIFKNATGIACPSCGTTRSLLALAKGNFRDALLINPLGFISGALLLILPFWLLYDLLFANDSLFKNYKKFENTLKIKWVAVILILLIASNWAWNIYKDL